MRYFAASAGRHYWLRRQLIALSPGRLSLIISPFRYAIFATLLSFSFGFAAYCFASWLPPELYFAMPD
jgi:hypothetical protein